MRPKYYCDFCNKGGGSGGHIKRHESACTKNPDRVCRMCKMLEQGQPQLSNLIALLPDPEAHKIINRDEFGREAWTSWNGLEEALKTALPALREAAGNCPACIMAAIRQRGIPVPEVTEFNFTNECKAIWQEINNAAWEEEQRSYYGQY